MDLLDQALIAEPPLLTRDGGFIAPGYDEELDEARTLRDEGRSVIAAMQAEYSELSGVPSLKIKHNNQTGRWVLPFRAVWTPAGDGVVIGSMRREVELFDSSSGKLAGKYSDAERMTAIASRYAVHPTKDIVAAGTASGRLHIYRK